MRKTVVVKKKTGSGRPQAYARVVNEKPAAAAVVLKRLLKVYPNVRCALFFETTFQLLVATILSAQCTDKRVNMVTPALFKALPDARAFMESSVSVIQEHIKSINFFRNKAKNLHAAATMIMKEFGGEVPRTMADMLRLPGVARKTANVVLGVGYGVSEGVVVDTHVRRLSLRLGLTKHHNPLHIEKDLTNIIPQAEWDRFSLLLIQHGRQICVARKPLCESCILNDICPSAFRPDRQKVS